MLDIDKLILPAYTGHLACSFSSMLDIDKLIRYSGFAWHILRFSSMLDIDKLIHGIPIDRAHIGFSSMLDIDKLIPFNRFALYGVGFSSMLDIDKLILFVVLNLTRLRHGDKVVTYMYIVDGIAYAGEASKELAVKDIKILDKMYMLVEFNTGEQRILDATVLLKYPVYQKLQSKEAFMSASVEDGVLVWLDGDIDIGTIKRLLRSIYEHSRKAVFFTGFEIPGFSCQAGAGDG